MKRVRESDGSSSSSSSSDDEDELARLKACEAIVSGVRSGVDAAAEKRARRARQRERRKEERRTTGNGGHVVQLARVGLGNGGEEDEEENEYDKRLGTRMAQLLNAHLEGELELDVFEPEHEQHEDEGDAMDLDTSRGNLNGTGGSAEQRGKTPELAVQHFRLFEDSKRGIVHVDSTARKKEEDTKMKMRKTNDDDDDEDKDELERDSRVKSVVVDKPLKPLFYERKKNTPYLFSNRDNRVIPGKVVPHGEKPAHETQKKKKRTRKRKQT